MSLDVHLIEPLPTERREARSVIFVRDDGQTKEITRAEWDERYPGREPVTVDCSDEVYWRNITHNLGKMADAAGLYQHLWRPDEIGITHARQLIGPLADGLGILRGDPEKFRAFNAANGWGKYENLVDFVAEYLEACKEHPDAEVSVSR